MKEEGDPAEGKEETKEPQEEKTGVRMKVDSHASGFSEGPAS